MNYHKRRVLAACVILASLVGCTKQPNGGQVEDRPKSMQEGREGVKTHQKSSPVISKTPPGKSPSAKKPAVSRRVISFVSRPTPEQKKRQAAMAKWNTAKYGDILDEWTRVRESINTLDKNNPDYVRAYELWTVYHIRLYRALQRDFIITGAIVDDAGHPVEDVSFHMTKSRTKIGGWESEDEEVNLTIPSRFELHVEGANAVYLGFWKKGYYPVKPSILDRDSDTYNGKVMMEAFKKDRFPRRVVRRHLRIVLERQGKLTRLKGYRERIFFYADHSARAIDFEKPPSDLYEESLRHIENTRDRSTWPKHCAVLLAETEGTGKNARIAILPRPNRRFAKGVKLVLNDPDGGFQLADFTHPGTDRLVDPKIPWKPWRIKQAPKTGYDLKELSLEGLRPSLNHPVYFYVKVKGSYGWGWITSISVPDDRTKVECVVQFRLQPDGSRNLEEEDRF